MTEQEIKDNAPDGATHWLYDTYFKKVNTVEWYYWEEGKWKFTSYDKKFAHLLKPL
jgi:hypothetical protein